MLKDDSLFASAIAIRIFTINYFFWFQPWTIIGQMRQCVRFTDMQTVMVSLLRMRSNNENRAIAYNILGLITVGFWCAKCLGIDETLEQPKYPFLQKEICRLYHYINHGLLFGLMHIEYTPFNDNKEIGGDTLQIGKSLRVILFYLMCIYIPWYFFTDDRIYDI